MRSTLRSPTSRRILDGNAKAVLFDAVGPEQAALAGNVLASRSRFAAAFGVAPERLLPEVLRRLRTAPQLVEVAARPRAGAAGRRSPATDVDVTTLPAHVQHGQGRRTVHLGGDRHRRRSGDEAHQRRAAPPDGARAHRDRDRPGRGERSAHDLPRRRRARERLPLSIVVGSHPIDYFAATMRVPVDELGLVASLRDAPLAGREKHHQRSVASRPTPSG